jgi:hypothetical protein
MSNVPSTWAIPGSDRGSGKPPFVKLKDDGDTLRCVFLGDPHFVQSVWTGSRYERYDPSVHKMRPKTQVKMNVYDADDGRVKIAEFNGPTWDMILDCLSDIPADSWIFKIRRKGGKGDPKTRYIVSPEQRIPEDRKGKILSLKTYDLKDEGINT